MTVAKGFVEETLPAGTASLYHLHRDSDEVAWVLAGQFTEVTVQGDPELINRYDVIQLNPEKQGKDSLGEARRLADWLVSPEGQRAIGGYEMHGEQLFHPSAAAPK
jgi:ABC-type tungstate transport system permease subunit